MFLREQTTESNQTKNQGSDLGHILVEQNNCYGKQTADSLVWQMIGSQQNDSIIAYLYIVLKSYIAVVQTLCSRNYNYSVTSLEITAVVASQPALNKKVSFQNSPTTTYSLLLMLTQMPASCSIITFSMNNLQSLESRVENAHLLSLIRIIHDIGKFIDWTKNGKNSAINDV